MENGENAVSVLLGYVERIEGLEAERKELADAIKEEKRGVKASLGIDTGILNKVLKIRASDPEKLAYEVQETTRLLELLARALKGGKE
jgi:uncharacterized protein (UPF0335 family)